MKTLALFGSLAFLLVAGAVAQKPEQGEAVQPSITLPPELARVLTDYERAWSTKDAVGLARLFDESGFVLSPRHPIVRGREAIEHFYTGSGGPLSLRAVAFAKEGNVGYIIGAYGAQPGAPDDGKFTLTLRCNASGRWLIFSDMDNGNGAPWP